MKKKSPPLSLSFSLLFSLLPEQRVVVELDPLHGVQRRPVHIAVVGMQGQGMPNEIYGRRSEAKLCIQGRHRHPAEVAPAVRPRVLFLVILDEDEEVARAPLLEQAQQRRPQRLHVSRRDALHFARVGRGDKRTVDGLEFEVAGHFRADQDADEFAPAHDEFGDRVYVVVTGRAQVGGGEEREEGEAAAEQRRRRLLRHCPRLLSRSPLVPEAAAAAEESGQRPRVSARASRRAG